MKALGSYWTGKAVWQVDRHLNTRNHRPQECWRTSLTLNEYICLVFFPCIKMNDLNCHFCEKNVGWCYSIPPMSVNLLTETFTFWNLCSLFQHTDIWCQARCFTYNFLTGQLGKRQVALAINGNRYNTDLPDDIGGGPHAGAPKAFIPEFICITLFTFSTKGFSGKIDDITLKITLVWKGMKVYQSNTIRWYGLCFHFG